VHFRRAEHFFTRKKYRDAEGSYEAIIKMGPVSEYYELALYKLGWSLYKQEHVRRALRQYVALLDYKVSIGYDFDAKHEEGDERRISDTFDIISLSFSNNGGPEAVQQFFARNGKRSYEDRVYRNLGEYYLTKLRYHDAAKSYNTFIAQVPAAQALAALQHARDRDLRDRPLPAAGAGLEEGFRQATTA
jgi:tetratricopeptide (TPR) repeat protein